MVVLMHLPLLPTPFPIPLLAWLWTNVKNRRKGVIATKRMLGECLSLAGDRTQIFRFFKSFSNSCKCMKVLMFSLPSGGFRESFTPEAIRFTKSYTRQHGKNMKTCVWIIFVSRCCRESSSCLVSSTFFQQGPLALTRKLATNMQGLCADAAVSG